MYNFPRRIFSSIAQCGCFASLYRFWSRTNEIVPVYQFTFYFWALVMFSTLNPHSPTARVNHLCNSQKKGRGKDPSASLFKFILTRVNQKDQRFCQRVSTVVNEHALRLLSSSLFVRCKDDWRSVYLCPLFLLLGIRNYIFDFLYCRESKRDNVKDGVILELMPYEQVGLWFISLCVKNSSLGSTACYRWRNFTPTNYLRT